MMRMNGKWQDLVTYNLRKAYYVDTRKTHPHIVGLIIVYTVVNVPRHGRTL